MNNVLSVNDVAAWLDGYKEAWETLDPEKAAQLFSEDAIYRDQPYEEPHQGREGIREYWRNVTSDQKDVTFTYEVLAVTNSTGITHWHSEFSSKSSDAAITLDGIFILDFNDDGLCANLKEWWHLKVDSEEGAEFNH